MNLSASHTGRLYPQEIFLVLIFREMERSEGNMSLKKLVIPPGIDPGTVRLVAQCLNHYATLCPFKVKLVAQKTRRLVLLRVTFSRIAIFLWIVMVQYNIL
jgi:hypothetical protein